MTPEQQALVQAEIDVIEREIQEHSNIHDEQKRKFRERVGLLTAKRDELAIVLRAHRAGLGHLIAPVGIESQAKVGTPGQ